MVKPLHEFWSTLYKLSSDLDCCLNIFDLVSSSGCISSKEMNIKVTFDHIKGIKDWVQTESNAVSEK